MAGYFSQLVEQSIVRAKESTLSVLGVANPSLRKHLGKLMSAECGTGESFLAQPLFEHTFAWEEAQVQVKQLKGQLLTQAVIKALDDKANDRYRFGADFYPFKHQLEAWQTLLADKPKSVVVTSGTGSGKTECFMVPVLEDLYREYQQKQAPLVGVRALFLYPLNALINSQQERLDAWTRHFGDDIRYCLYNGNTLEAESQCRKEQAQKPNHVLSRELLRKAPTPILVTNGTMLEYMLVRQIDAPIIEHSRAEKSLRWIVLDEAHTYAGSQAAELALQLRRVLQAFGVEAKDVRFVATSATIAGEQASQQLRQYLAALAGVDPQNVKVIGGRRVIPELDFVSGNELNLDQLEQIELQGQLCKVKYEKNKERLDPEVSSLRFQALQASPTAHAIRDAIVQSNKPLTLQEINQRVGVSLDQPELPQAELLRWLDLLSGTKATCDGQAFLKLRAHFFQRMTQGLWSCIDKNCSCKTGTDLATSWPFGYVYSVHRQTCKCGAPVLELVFCTECNEPHLLARDKNGYVAQWDNRESDEFSLQQDDIEDDGGDEQPEDQNELQKDITINSLPEVFAAKVDDPQDEEAHYVMTQIGLDGQIASIDSQGYELAHDSARAHVCCECGFKGYNSGSPFRRSMLGAPFYIANVVPTLLEFSQDFVDENNTGIGVQSLPARGRRLITFTDSRQGTARISVRMQQEAERSKLRGAVVEVLRNKQLSQPVIQDQPSSGTSIEDLIRSADLLRRQGMIGLAEDLEKQIQALSAGAQPVQLVEITWNEMVQALAQKEDFKGEMLFYNKYLSPEVFGANDGSHKLAEMLLFREYSRRPKRQNSTETQGLVKLDYAGLEQVHACPDKWQENGLTLDDWRDFLKISLDFYVREGNFLKMEESGWMLWIGSRFYPKTLRNPNSDDKDELRVKKWPQVQANTSNPHRLVKLLAMASKLSLDNPANKDRINLWLTSAWIELTDKTRILVPDGNKYALDRSKLIFSMVDQVFICPLTNKLLDTTFKGLTPYLPRNVTSSASVQCQKVAYPQIWQINDSQSDFAHGLLTIRKQVAENQQITYLREQNLWTDINDRAVEGGLYYRTAEHSAQQSADRLQKYEQRFKEGKINVLNCSTTMEMGVDIGGITAVVMNNVPPHPANYLQRAGRAGRSKESRAISYTLCKSNPHDQQVFANPKWPFTTLIAAPKVALNSERLAQRHANSLLLSLFLKQVIGTTFAEKTKLNLKWFYLSDQVSICEQFLTWLQSDALAWDHSITSLVRGTTLATHLPSQVRDAAAQQINQQQQQWLKEHQYLTAEMASATPKSPYEYRLGKELDRLERQFLLGELAATAFLPGYGFPTDVVTFDNNNIVDYFRNKNQKKSPKEEREDNVSRHRGLPSRNLAVAIREYAPGAEIVLDGRVFRSGGVALHWQNVSGMGANEAQKFDLAWRCEHCGQTGYETDVSIDSMNILCTNPRCGNKIKSKNIRQVLQPTGFVSDFYYEPTNDVSLQRFVPIQPAWVSVGNAAPMALPNSAMGHFACSANGTIFHHTSGLNGTGYALCMCCGRAESLDSHGDYPKNLSPGKAHEPIRITAKYKDNNRDVECEGSNTLIKGIHLGCHSRTDVFELVLKHPKRNEFILDGKTADGKSGRIIATTLAVALRSAVASILGISTSELGYAVRPALIENSKPILVIQLFDTLAGGAGFASSVNQHIQEAIDQMVRNLTCDHCQNGCGECLLEGDTRHDLDKIDSELAREWLGADFTRFNQLPEELRFFPDGQYQPYSLAGCIRQQIHRGAKSLVCYLNENLAEWDLTHPNFKHSLVNYVTSDQIDVTFAIPDVELDEATQQELSQYQMLGVKLVTMSSWSEFLAVQMICGEQIISFGSNNIDNLCPGEQWHRAEGTCILSKAQPLPDFVLKSASIPSMNAKSSGATTVNPALEITTQFNGKLSQFGDQFWSCLLKHDTQLLALIQREPLVEISYSDRYIQSPASLLLITEIISALCKVKSGVERLIIETLYHSKDRLGHYLHHDWQDKDDFVDAYATWLESKTGLVSQVICHETRNTIAHRRMLVLKFGSGKSLRVKLDQGVGYWQLNNPMSKFSSIRYSFESDLKFQLVELTKLEGDLVVKNSEQWSTDVSYQQQL